MRKEKKGLLAGFQKLSCSVVVKMRNIIGSNRKEQNMTALIMQTHTQAPCAPLQGSEEPLHTVRVPGSRGGKLVSTSPGQATFLTVNENYQSKEL